MFNTYNIYKLHYSLIHNYLNIQVFRDSIWTKTKIQRPLLVFLKSGLDVNHHDEFHTNIVKTLFTNAN